MSDTSLTTALDQAHDSLDTATDRHRALGDGLTKLGAHLAGASDEVRARHGQVVASHGSLGRSLDAAKLALAGIADAAQSESYVEPTHGPQGGSQVDQSYSAGPPRGFTLDEIRRRDQRRGIEAGYVAKIKALRGH